MSQIHVGSLSRILSFQLVFASFLLGACQGAKKTATAKGPEPGSPQQRESPKRETPKEQDPCQGTCEVGTLCMATVSPPICAHVVFVTREAFTGDLREKDQNANPAGTGRAGADAKCRAAAQRNPSIAPLAPFFKAVLFTEQEPTWARFNSKQPVYLSDRVTRVSSSLSSMFTDNKLDHPIELTEDGEPHKWFSHPPPSTLAWIGAEKGLPLATCNDWTNDKGGEEEEKGRVGNAAKLGAQAWSEVFPFPCDEKRSLCCLSIPEGSP